MKAPGFVISALVPVLCLAIAACGQAQNGAAAEAPATDSPAGVWEMRYQDVAGQSYLNVLELRPDRAYATYMQDATPDDHGAYSIADGALSFKSDVDSRFSQNLPFELHGDLLKIFIAPYPGAGAEPITAEWRRSEAAPAFRTVEVDGDELPAGLPGMTAAAMAAQALPWREDALPVSLEIEIAPPGRRARLTLLFFSPSANEGLRLVITKYGYASNVIDGSRMPHRPLPANFVDLADVVAKMSSDGVDGAFRRADLKTYEGAGPAWMLHPDGPQGATYSAVTGERIKGDVTGYIAQYEADWAKNAQVWREVFERYASCPPGEARDRLFGGGCMTATTSSLCAQWGGRWMKQGYSNEGYCAHD